MVGVDLTKGILMEIVVETGETCRKYNLGETNSIFYKSQANHSEASPAILSCYAN